MLVLSVDLQSLMIASIPNIIGWLAISFAQVSDHFYFDIYATIWFTSFFHCLITGLWPL